MKKPNYFLRTAKIFLLSLLFPLCGMAQTTSDAYVSMDDIPGASISGTYYVILTDTNSISQIETGLGTTSGSTDVLNHTFNYDVSSGLPAGYSYTREGNKLILGIGTFTERNSYYGSVRIKNTSGTWSSPYSFITN